MPLRQPNNTSYPPIKIRDLLYRGANTGLESFIPEDIHADIPEDWIYYIKQTSSYMGVDTDILTSYIYEHFKDRIINDRYADNFEGWEESTDFAAFCNLITCTIANTLISNQEKYSKIFYAQYAEFNPMWNVDGTEVTERTLDQTGTDENAKSGKDTNTKTGNETDEKSGTEANTRTGDETTELSGTDTKTTSRTSYDSDTFYDVEKVVDSPTQREDKVTYNSVKDEQSFNNRKDTHTYNQVKDQTDYDSKDTETRNLHDVEYIKHTRQGNIGVVSTVRLLQEYVELSELNILDVIARDVVNSFTYMTY